MKKLVAPLLFSLVVTTAAPTRAAAPIGETIWLYWTNEVPSYVTAADLAKGVKASGAASIGMTEEFRVEDAGSGNILLKAFNDNYWLVDPADVDKIYANTTDTNNLLAHFTWTDVPGNKVRLTVVGDDGDSLKNVSPSGGSEVLRANTSSTGPETEFIWGIVGSIGTITTLSATVDDESVSLDWDDDTSGVLDFYRVYRSPESGSNYVQIATGLTNSEYVDSGIPGGITYYYVATAVDTEGTESPFGNEVAATPYEVVRLQHLDAAVTGSVVTVSGVVTQWIDQTSSGNDAVPAVGNTLYPSTSLVKSGLAGIDVQSSRNSLKLFSAGDSDSWLDQSGSTNGFCVMVALKCDAVRTGVDNDVIGNSADGASGFGMGITGTSNLQAWLGGQVIPSAGAAVVEDGETLVLALNYDAAAGTYDFWDSLNSSSVTGSLPKADFSLGTPVTVGSAASSSRYLDGVVGEVKVFGSRLSPANFKRQRDEMTQQWYQRPNIVLIYLDDWSWNGTPIQMDDRMPNSHFPDIIEMPNLEAMAASGMIFRNAYGSPQCSPARAAIQTGQSNPRNGFTVFLGTDDYYDTRSQYAGFPVVPNGADQTLRPGTVTIPEALAPLGYVSAHIGKWHMRGDPGDEGYARHDGPTTNNEGNNYDDATGLEGLTDPKLMKHVTDSGIAFMEEQVAAGLPFYVQFSHYAMHGGWECFPASRARYQNHPAVVAYNGGVTDPAALNRNSDPAVFLGMAYELDQKIGEVRQKLVDLGIADNTYVIMMGDNGFRHGFFDELYGLTQPLHSAKWWLWQGGIRVPMVAEGPGIPAGSYCTANVANYDFLPTFVDWAGGDPGSLLDIDGMSLEGLMQGAPAGADFLERSLYFHYPHYRSSMPFSVMVKGHQKLVYFYETPVRFPAWQPVMYFDLGNDAGEYHNIYPQDPARAQALYSDMTNYLAVVGARIPLVPNPAYDPNVYTNDGGYAQRVMWGPFIGTRATESDEAGPTTFAEYWMDSWDVDLVSLTNDFDGDLLSNLGEYALGGNPTNALDTGIKPTLTYAGGQWQYTHVQRNDDSTLTYKVETTTNLAAGAWTDTAHTVTDTNLACDAYDEVVNAVSADEEQLYIRLEIEQQ
jgi:arylsulfatase A-like enzyme/fibronectin type 3 domain-containing protein